MLYACTEVGHRGQYSIEWLYAFDEYCRSASRLQVLAACCLLPVPPLLLILALELIPLQPPIMGWRANGALFVRAFFSAFIVALSVAMQAKNILPGVKLSLAKCLIVSTATALSYVGVLLLLAWAWVFPVPFSVALCSIPFTCLFMFFALLAIGRDPFRDNSTLWLRLRQFMTITIVLVGLTLIYPAYNAIFIRLSTYQQAGLVLLLPVIKTVVKYILARHVDGIEDYLPEIAVVSVEVFHALYLSTSMQNTGNSALVSCLIVSFDAIHLAVAYRRVRDRSEAIQVLINTGQRRSGRGTTRTGLVLAVIDICEKLSGSSSPPSQRAQLIRVRSCVQHTLSPATRNSIDRLARINTPQGQRAMPNGRQFSFPLVSTTVFILLTHPRRSIVPTPRATWSYCTSHCSCCSRARSSC